MQYICSPFVVLFCVLSSFFQNRANINNFLLTFQGKKVYKKYFFFITWEKPPRQQIPRLHLPTPDYILHGENW